MMNFININNIIPPIGKVYSFDDIVKFSKDLEEGNTNGKGIVIVDEDIV
jgi:NADPH:quinone reductase-like Zn-dependent oxidoreductase